MAKKQKLKDRLQKALLTQKIRTTATQGKERLVVPGGMKRDLGQHDPASMTMRHKWTDGFETEIPHRASRNQKILIIGDGDLSFSVALSQLLGDEANLLCTTFDSLQDLERKYGKELIASNLAKLGSQSVLHGLDGTKLHLNKALMKFNYSRIIFNYPHTGAGIKDRDRNIRAQQEMVRGFLDSASKVMLAGRNRSTNKKLVGRSVQVRSKDAPIVRRSKKRKTAGSDDDDDDDCHDEPDDEESDFSIMFEPEIHITMRTGDPYDDWKVKNLGGSIAALQSAESFRFEPGKYPGYRHVKTLGESEEGDEENFLMKPAKTYVFKLR